ncbi:MAG: hypothetical protein QXP70_06060 [Methanomassiliicoccales archaeon]
MSIAAIAIMIIMVAGGAFGAVHLATTHMHTQALGKTSVHKPVLHPGPVEPVQGQPPVYFGGNKTVNSFPYPGPVSPVQQ